MKEKYGETVQVVNAPYLGRPYSRFPRILSESPTNFLPVSETGRRILDRVRLGAFLKRSQITPDITLCGRSTHEEHYTAAALQPA